MNSTFHLTRCSRNRKTGPIPTSVSSRETCPVSCPFLGKGCYAEASLHLRLQWNRVTEKGDSFLDFLSSIRSLPKGQLWRHNVAGDLPGQGDEIDGEKLAQLVRANRGRRGFTYTHKPVVSGPFAEANRKVITEANRAGFTISLSANSLVHADELAATTCGPLVAVVPTEQTGNGLTRKGLRYVQCPATREGRKVTCATCGLCQCADRKVIVTFPAHGTFARHVSEISRSF